MLKVTTTSFYVSRHVKGNQWRETAEWCNRESALVLKYIIPLYVQKTMHYPSLAQVRETTCLFSWVTGKLFQGYIMLLNKSHTRLTLNLHSWVQGSTVWVWGGERLFLKIMFSLALGQYMWRTVGSQKVKAGNVKSETPWKVLGVMLSFVIQAYGYFPFFLHCTLFGPRNTPFGGRLGRQTQSSQWHPLCKTPEPHESSVRFWKVLFLAN